MAKILIVDDDIPLQGLMKAVLEGEGHEVVQAYTGPEVFSRLATERPDVLVLDVMLPEMDGLSLQTAIATDPDLSRIPVIVITAQESLLHLFGDFKQVKARLRKPIQNKDFIGAVEQALSDRPA